MLAAAHPLNDLHGVRNLGGDMLLSGWRMGRVFDCETPMNNFPVPVLAEPHVMTQTPVSVKAAEARESTTSETPTRHEQDSRGGETFYEQTT
jgi:hypothetical protein